MAKSPHRAVGPRPSMLALHWPLLALVLIAASGPWWPVDAGLLTRLALGWDAGVAVFLAGSFTLMARRNSPSEMRGRSAALDEVGPFILPVALLAAGASVAVVIGEAVKGENSALEAALTLATVALSWTFVHVIFALHYARRFYAEGAGGKDNGGLIFPGDAAPGYWDFLHFSLIIGVASQTADIQISDPAIRHLSTLHSVTAFVFNTVILALAVNLAVSLLGGN